jgi:hypothetical protein
LGLAVDETEGTTSASSEGIAEVSGFESGPDGAFNNAFAVAIVDGKLAEQVLEICRAN